MTLIDDTCDNCGSRFDPMGDPLLTKHPEVGPWAVFCAGCEHRLSDHTPSPETDGLREGSRCACGHPRSEHDGGVATCQERDRSLPCGCTKFAPRDPAPPTETATTERTPEEQLLWDIFADPTAATTDVTGGGLREDEREALAAAFYRAAWLETEVDPPKWAAFFGDAMERINPAVEKLIAARVAEAEAREVLDFVHWVAIARAHNGSEHQHGQSLYNECINAALPTWAAEYLTDRARGLGGAS